MSIFLIIALLWGIDRVFGSDYLIMDKCDFRNQLEKVSKDFDDLNFDNQDDKFCLNYSKMILILGQIGVAEAHIICNEEDRNELRGLLLNLPRINNKRVKLSFAFSNCFIHLCAKYSYCSFFCKSIMGIVKFAILEPTLFAFSVSVCFLFFFYMIMGDDFSYLASDELCMLIGVPIILFIIIISICRYKEYRKIKEWKWTIDMFVKSYFISFLVFFLLLFTCNWNKAHNKWKNNMIEKYGQNYQEVLDENKYDGEGSSLEPE